MKIILLRHVESEKNINKSFSSEQNQEAITKKGENQADLIANYIAQYVTSVGCSVKTVYAANSERAITTAKKIAISIGAEVLPVDSFISVTTDKSIKGKSENEILKSNPQFIYELSLYRAGLFNAYNYSTVADVIKSGQYERSVMEEFDNILFNDLETLKIIVLHHSSITALLINLARKMGIYPYDFYGRVDADLGSIYLINYDEKAKSFAFEIINEPPIALTKSI